jgi:hypothetical protein
VAAQVTEPERRYVAYLLRLWQMSEEGQVGWRASLENAHTGKRQGFSSLDDMFAYVMRQTGSKCDADDQDRGRQAVASDADKPEA